MSNQNSVEQARSQLRRRLRWCAWGMLGLLALVLLAVTAAASWVVSKGLLDALVRLLQGGGA